MPLQATSGAASYDAFGGGVPVEPVYIEQIFSTYLYTGTSATQTITNGIDLSGKGGLVWIKIRNDTLNNILFDTTRGDFELISNSTAAQADNNRDFVPLSTGFSLKGGENVTNNTPNIYTSWTFQEQPKFFDVVTYTGNDIAGRTIAHNLGSVPGCIIVKNLTSGARSWEVFHTSLGATKSIQLNLTSAATTSIDYWNNTAPTSTVFTVGGNNTVNTDTHNYVAYLFAHNAGGFGLTGTDNVISCGSFTTNGSGIASVSLGYEPQWAIWKRTDSTSAWNMVDNMRGWSVTNGQLLSANTSNAESANNPAPLIPNATGFSVEASASATYIYIAIRRGPMKVPTTGTSVFSPDLYTGNGTTQTVTSGSPPLDLVWIKGRTGSNNPRLYDRLRGATKALAPDSTAAETTRADGLTAFTQTGFTVGSFGNENESGVSIIAWDFRRAPSFFDEVCYTGGSPYGRAHNLTVVPELMIVKCRDTGYDWAVYSSALGNTKYLSLSSSAAVQTDTDIWSSTTPTATTFYGGPNSYSSGGGALYVSYLFATCAGVSKVGSYTGTGTTKQIDCGFTAGARFVLIKRTDSTGDWYVWDSARGIIAGNDPYLLLNTSTNEVTNTDYIDTAATGFEISSTAPAAINASGGTFIFLAVA